MRSLLSFILTGTVGLTAGCTSGLWGPFTQDTESNCNVTPSLCATGQSCNAVTGLCEGGSVADMGVPPSGPIFGQERLVTSLATSYFSMAIGDLTKGDKTDILLSADTENLLILSGDDNFSASSAETFSLSGGQKPTYSVNYTQDGRHDAIVATVTGKIIYVLKKDTTTAKVEIDSGLGPGYLVLDVGYANDDNTPDLVVTSSKLSLISQILLGTMVGTGNASVFLGALNATMTPQPLKLGRTDLCFAAAARQPDMELGLALSKPRDTSTTLLQITGSTINGTGNQHSPMPEHDFAIPTDLDKDGDLDLVLVKTFELPTPGNLTSGKVHYLMNNGNVKSPTFTQDATQLNSSYLIGAQVDDFDGDGYPDIVVAEYVEKRFRVYHNLGLAQTSFSAPFDLSGTYGARSAYFQDLDGDGCKDLVALFGGDESGGAATRGSEIKIVRGRFKAGGTCQ